MTVLLGDCRETLKAIASNSIASIVTDPPYEIGFMGKKWDASGIAYDPEVWDQCLRVLKPGGHLLAFGGTRTYHRMTCAIEDAGFEIRDSLHWLYGSGFPKSLDVSKAIDKAAGATRPIVGPTRPGAQSTATNAYGAWGDGITPTVAATPAAAAAAGWGTALKPAHEPIVLARKPLVGTVATNVMEYGTGALNIDGTRVGSEPMIRNAGRAGIPSGTGHYVGTSAQRPHLERKESAGRWPANIILTHSPECEQVGTRKVRTGTAVNRNGHDPARQGYGGGWGTDPRPDLSYADADGTETVAAWNCVSGCPVATLNEQSGTRPMGDTSGASRFFATSEWHPEMDAPFLYVAKPSRRERNVGFDGMPKQVTNQATPPGTPGAGSPRPGANRNGATANFHPTVKPVALMRYLVRLVTPPGGTVLDPFLGSGTTAVAAILEGFEWKGCELTADYLPIIEARTKWAYENPDPITPPTLFDGSEEK